MPLPERRVEDVERRAGSRIDLEDGELAAVDQHVETVEPDEAERGGERVARLFHPLGESRRDCDGPDTAAIAERRPPCGRRPLPAEPDDARGATIRQEQRGNRLTVDDSLEIPAPARDGAGCCGPNMSAP